MAAFLPAKGKEFCYKKIRTFPGKDIHAYPAAFTCIGPCPADRFPKMTTVHERPWQ